MAESFWAELPLGLSMTLAKDPVAKGVFDGLSPEERRAFVEGCIFRCYWFLASIL